MSSEIKKVEGYEVDGILFHSEELAEKHVLKKKHDILFKHALEGSIIKFLEEMINQNITNRSRIKLLLKTLKNKLSKAGF